VNTICETDTGIFWIGTRAGMSRFDMQTGKFTHYVHKPDSLNTLPDNYVWNIIEDSEKKLWIATRNGLSNFNPETKAFRNFRKDQPSSGSISHNFILEIVEDS
jgi:ligand-binding sensor domain-containing protein